MAMDRLNSEIDALTSTTTHAELAAGVQNILREMTYYLSQSEAVILDHRERWHDEYTDALYADAGESAPPRTSQKSKTSGKSRRKALTPDDSEKAKALARAEALARTKANSQFQTARTEAKARVKAARSGLSSSSTTAHSVPVPSSLQAIMDGSHPSFREDDEVF